MCITCFYLLLPFLGVAITSQTLYKAVFITFAMLIYYFYYNIIALFKDIKEIFKIRFISPYNIIKAFYKDKRRGTYLYILGLILYLLPLFIADDIWIIGAYILGSLSAFMLSHSFIVYNQED